jgi:hypothetical protein
VSIRQLSWLQLRASRQLAQAESARNLIALGGAQFARAYKEMLSVEDEDEPPAGEAQAQPGAPTAAPPEAEPAPAPPVDPLAGHDLLTVLIGGLPTYTREAVEDLAEADAEFLGRAILALSPKPRTEDEEKNAASPSTAV